MIFLDFNFYIKGIRGYHTEHNSLNTFTIHSLTSKNHAMFNICTYITGYKEQIQITIQDSQIENNICSSLFLVEK